MKTDPDQVDTLPPPPLDEDHTREMRRASYIIGAVEPAVADVAQALAVEPTPAQVRHARGVMAHHLESAWTDGASRETDLRMAVDVLRSELHAMRSEAAATRELVERLHATVLTQRDRISQLERELHSLRGEKAS